MIQNRIYVALLLAMALSSYSCSKNRGEAPKHLLWYGIGGEATDIPKVFEQVSSQLADMGRNYAVKYVRFGWGDFNQKIQLILASGEPADITFMANWAGNYYSTASSGYLAELDELLEGKAKLKASLPNDFWNAVRVGGKIYAVPNYKDMVYQDYAAFNSELLEKHNIELPKNLSWENVTPILEQMIQVEPDYIAYDGGGAWRIHGDYPLGANIPLALSFAEPNKGFRVLTEIPEFQVYARLMREWVEKSYRDKNAYLKKDKDQASTKSWFMRDYQGFPGAEVNLAKSWGVPMKAVWLNGPPILDNSTPLGGMLSIPAASPNQQEAFDFISLLNTDPAMRNLIGYGIEGEHHNLDVNGQVVYTEKGRNNYDMPNFSLGSLLILKTVAGEALDSREQLRTFNEEAKASPALGFPIDVEKYRQVIAQVSATSEAYLDSVKYGLKPANEVLSEWRSKLRELGWFEVVDEINQNYMEWKQ